MTQRLEKDERLEQRQKSSAQGASGREAILKVICSETVSGSRPLGIAGQMSFDGGFKSQTHRLRVLMGFSFDKYVELTNWFISFHGDMVYMS